MCVCAGRYLSVQSLLIVSTTLSVCCTLVWVQVEADMVLEFTPAATRESCDLILLVCPRYGWMKWSEHAFKNE